MTHDEQAQLDRFEDKLDRALGQLTETRISIVAHTSDGTRHVDSEQRHELSALRRDVIKLGAAVGGIVLVVNGIALAVLSKIMVH